MEGRGRFAKKKKLLFFIIKVWFSKLNLRLPPVTDKKWNCTWIFLKSLLSPFPDDSYIE